MASHEYQMAPRLLSVTHFTLPGINYRGDNAAPVWLTTVTNFQGVLRKLFDAGEVEQKEERFADFWN